MSSLKETIDEYCATRTEELTRDLICLVIVAVLSHENRKNPCYSLLPGCGLTGPSLLWLLRIFLKFQLESIFS